VVHQNTKQRHDLAHALTAAVSRSAELQQSYDAAQEKIKSLELNMKDLIEAATVELMDRSTQMQALSEELSAARSQLKLAVSEADQSKLFTLELQQSLEQSQAQIVKFQGDIQEVVQAATVELADRASQFDETKLQLARALERVAVYENRQQSVAQIAAPPLGNSTEMSFQTVAHDSMDEIVYLRRSLDDSKAQKDLLRHELDLSKAELQAMKDSLANSTAQHAAFVERLLLSHAAQVEVHVCAFGLTKPVRKTDACIHSFHRGSA
jgi:hypothetical protein